MATRTSVPDGHPEWTERAERQGQDPLGMQSTSVALYQSLVPGISNVTQRVRYYAFHSWLATQYSREVRSPDTENWRVYLRRGEVLFALVARHNRLDGGVGGANWADKALQAAEGRVVRFDTSADAKDGAGRYLQQTFGAFGVAYGAQLRELGLLGSAKGHAVPIPTARGIQLADRFAASVGAAGPRFLAAAKRGTVSVSELEAMTAFAPSAAADSEEERGFLEQLLFAPGAPADSPAASRRRSLRFVLLTARALGWDVDTGDVRWTAYSGFDEEGGAMPRWEGQDSDCSIAWRAYHGNDLTHYAYEALLRFSLQTLQGQPSGMPMQQLLKAVTDKLLSCCGRAATWADFEAACPAPANAWSDDADSEWTLHKALEVDRAGTAYSAKTACKALRLLAVLAQRFGGAWREGASAALKPVTGDSALTLMTELTFLERRRHEPLDATILALVKRVLDRHQEVAAQKLRAGDYTFLFDVEDGLVRFRQMAGPVLTNPRLAASIRFMTDLGLLGESGVTPRGAAVLEV